MKKSIIFLFMIFIISNNLISQNMPQWVRMGMTEADINNILDGNLERRSGLDDFFYWIDRANRTTYVFIISPEKGLTQFWMLRKFNFDLIVSFFTETIGEPTTYRYSSYTWRSGNFPENVRYVRVAMAGDEVHADVYFIFENFYD